MLTLNHYLLSRFISSNRFYLVRLAVPTILSALEKFTMLRNIFRIPNYVKSPSAQTISKKIKTSYCQERSISYVQGQAPEPKIREYFYYIDHQGMLFLDDSKMKNFTSCFKEKKFLEFFFKRIRLNNTGRYEEEFPFISLCGRERNFIRCDDVPIVYTNIVKVNGIELLSYGYAGDLLTSEFKPDKIYMLPSTGRVYHPADDKYGGVGLIKSKLAIELSKYFEFNDENLQTPTQFTWHGKRYDLDKNWFQEEVSKYKLKIRSDSDC